MCFGAGDRRFSTINGFMLDISVILEFWNNGSHSYVHHISNQRTHRQAFNCNH